MLAAARPGAGDRDPDAVLAVAREVVDGERARLVAGEPARDVAALGAAVVAALEAFDGPQGAGDEPIGGPVRVINATGRRRPHEPRPRGVAAGGDRGGAPRRRGLRSSSSWTATTGRRGPRYRAAEEHLVALTGAEDALVVTNNAAAIALGVGLAGRGGGVAVSRGELVEIGGGVRIPEILRRAGVRLVEVGTTNRTRVADFEAALADPKARIRLVLRVHPSNFVQTGFVEAPDPAELAATAHRHGALVVDDLGSGALLPTERVGLAHEPTPRERLAAGADLVTFSGDKLVGGPQAGLIVGRRDLIAKLRRDPLARAMRPDKTILAAVAATLALYRAGRATTEIPVWRMLSTPIDVAAGPRRGARGRPSRRVGRGRRARIHRRRRLAAGPGAAVDRDRPGRRERPGRDGSRDRAPDRRTLRRRPDRARARRPRPPDGRAARRPGARGGDRPRPRCRLGQLSRP